MPCAVMVDESVNTHIAGVVLCGGKSSRMGQDKTELRYHHKPLYEHARILLHQSGIRDVYLAGRGEIIDIHKERGPLGGLHAALLALGDHYQSLLIIPVDMPLLQTVLLKTLIHYRGDYQAVYFQNNPMPLKLSTSNEVQTSLDTLLAQTIIKTSIRNFLLQLKSHALPLPQTTQYSLINANTPQDWQDITGECL